MIAYLLFCNFIITYPTKSVNSALFCNTPGDGDSPPPPRVILSVVELSCLHESARRYADAESREGFAQDDTQRYGLLKDDALYKVCIDFPIGVSTIKSCL